MDGQSRPVVGQKAVSGRVTPAEKCVLGRCHGAVCASWNGLGRGEIFRTHL